MCAVCWLELEGKNTNKTALFLEPIILSWEQIHIAFHARQARCLLVHLN